MNSKLLFQIKNKLKSLLKDKEIIDIILFGSSIKGKASPNDIDIAAITENESIPRIEGFHISAIKPKEFFQNPPTLITTLLREGYSLKNNKMFAETFRFKPEVLFNYNLKNLANSQKVKIVNILRGKGKNSGLVKESNGNFISNSVFTIPPESEYLIEKFLINQNVAFKKSYILIH